MQKLIVSILFLFGLNIASAQNMEWIITINTQDCNTCLAEIPKITNLNNLIPSTIVFKSSDRGDSTLWIEKFFLEDYKGKIVFNDKMYNKYAFKESMQQSTITLHNGQLNTNQTVQLSSLARAEFNLNNLLDKTDTINFDEDYFNNNTRYNISLKNYLLFNSRRGNITVLNRTTKSKVAEYKLTDSLAIIAYTNKFGKEGAKILEDVKKYVKRTKSIGQYNQFIEFKSINDTVYAFAQHPIYFDTLNKQTNKRDTILTVFYSLVRAYDNKYIDINTIESYLNYEYWYKPVMARDPKTLKDAYFLSQIFLVNGDEINVGILGDYIEEGSDNWAIAKYKKQKNGYYVFDKYRNRLPLPYVRDRIGYGYINNYVQDRNYFVFQLGDTLLSINSNLPDIPLPFISKQQSASHQTMVNDFKIDGKYLYLLVNEADETIASQNTYLYKYNIETKKIEQTRKYDVRELNYTFNFPKIDPFDYNYIFYESNGKTLLRVKALN